MNRKDKRMAGRNPAGTTRLRLVVELDVLPAPGQEPEGASAEITDRLSAAFALGGPLWEDYGVAREDVEEAQELGEPLRYNGYEGPFYTAASVRRARAEDDGAHGTIQIEPTEDQWLAIDEIYAGHTPFVAAITDERGEPTGSLWAERVVDDHTVELYTVAPDGSYTHEALEGLHQGWTRYDENGDEIVRDDEDS